MDQTQHAAKTPYVVTPGTVRRSRAAGLAILLGLAAVFGLSSTQTADSARDYPPSDAFVSSAAADSSRFILNALLVPALDGDAMPLRWVDPRPILKCGPNTAVRVNRKPLVAGALVPDQPFELEWLADGCRPFGASGARLDGLVKLTVFREDWGFSAMVEPAGLRITSSENETTMLHPRAASLPQSVDADEPVMLTADSAHR